MITEELLQFMRTQLSAGETRESITTKLVTEGNWSEGDVDKAFSMLSENATPQAPSPSSDTPNGATSFGAPSEGAHVQPGNQERGSGQSKRTAPLLPLLMIGAVLMIGVVLFVVFSPLLGSRHSMAKDIDGFVESFARAMQDIERFEYQVSLDMTQEPQDGSVEMLTIVDPTYASLEEAVGRDVELYRNASTLQLSIQNYAYGQSGGFPVSLNDTAFLQDQSYYLERMGTIDSEVFTYRQTEGGQNYVLTIQFETKEMFEYLEESAEENQSTYSSGKPPVFNAEALTMSVSRDGRMPYPASLSQVLEKNPLILALEAMNFAAQSLPARYKADLVFSGVVGVEQGEGEIPDTENVLAVNVDWGDLAVSVDAGLLIKDDEVFAKVDRFPSLFFIDIEPIRGKWINLSVEDLGSGLFGDVSDPELNEAKEKLKEVPRLYAEAIAEYNPFIFTKKPRVETAENGEDAVVYSLGINKDNIAGFLESLRTKFIALDIVPSDEVDEFISDSEELIAFFETEEFVQVVEHMNKYVTFEVWMDKKTGYPTQYVQEFVFVPNPEMMPENPYSFLGAPTATKNTQLRTRSVLTLANINNNITIQKPESSISLEEATALITGRSVDDARVRAGDAKVKAAINNLRALAELYYDAEGSYLGVCSSSDSNSLATEIEAAKEEVPMSDPQCFDSATAYAVEATLSDGSLYCVDSTGVALNISSGKSAAGTLSCSE